MQGPTDNSKNAKYARHNIIELQTTLIFSVCIKILTVGNGSNRFKREARALPRPSTLPPVIVYPGRVMGGLTPATPVSGLNMSPRVTSSGEGGHLPRRDIPRVKWLRVSAPLSGRKMRTTDP